MVFLYCHNANMVQILTEYWFNIITQNAAKSISGGGPPDLPVF